jgi:hypothetical protein
MELAPYDNGKTVRQFNLHITSARIAMGQGIEPSV